MGVLLSSPLGDLAERHKPWPKTVLVHFQVERTHLMATLVQSLWGVV